MRCSMNRHAQKNIHTCGPTKTRRGQKNPKRTNLLCVSLFRLGNRGIKQTLLGLTFLHLLLCFFSVHESGSDFL